MTVEDIRWPTSLAAARERIVELELENARLREALTKIRFMQVPWQEMPQIARRALREPPQINWAK
jgi:hypothetical protein